MILNIYMILISLSNIGLLFAINMITKRINRHETYILELINIMQDLFSKEEDDCETE